MELRVELRGELVWFQLSPEGQQALSGLFESRFEALVVAEDDLGLWISPQRFPAETAHAEGVSDERLRKAIPVYLLKRKYFSTAELNMDADTLADLMAAGSA